jgi:hypothetical protein
MSPNAKRKSLVSRRAEAQSAVLPAGGRTDTRADHDGTSPELSMNAPSRFVVVVFLAVLAAPPLVQTVVERGAASDRRRCRSSPATDPENLRAYDKSSKPPA